MKIIPNWQNMMLKCYFCGETRSVKYAVELPGAICDNKPLEVCACNKCALIHSNDGYAVQKIGYCPLCDKDVRIVTKASMTTCPDCGHHISLRDL